MNPSAFFQRFRISFFGILLSTALVFSCQDHDLPGPTDASTYSAEVLTSWLRLQLKITQAAPISQPATARRFAYTGIALYESIVPGLAGYQSIAPQLNGLGTLPGVRPDKRYYWPACANAALATMNRHLHPTASAALKVSIDSLEAANTARYQQDRPLEELTRSAEFGKRIADAVFNWSKTDGYDNAAPYTPPIGAGLWVPTPPGFAAAALPHWGTCRPLVKDSGAGADPGTPTTYSEDPASAYYAQAKEVYDVSQKLTAEQRAIALFWPDHLWHNVLAQVLAKEKPTLDVAAVAFAQLGIAMSDAAVALFKSKYQYNAVRPITYIRQVLHQPTWNTVFATPAHPEYPSGHSVLSAAAAQTLTLLFGANYAYTDTPSNGPGVSPRSYRSFEEAAIEAGDSRVYAGIHYRKTCEVSLGQGKRIAQNVAGKLRFRW